MKQQVKTLARVRLVGKVDEAHLLSHEQLEAVRMLTNHEMDSSTRRQAAKRTAGHSRIAR